MKIKIISNENDVTYTQRSVVIETDDYDNLKNLSFDEISQLIEDREVELNDERLEDFVLDNGKVFNEDGYSNTELLIEDEEGHEIILTYLNDGEFIGEMGLFEEQPYRSVMVRTRTPCLLAEITYTHLMQLADGSLADIYKDILFAIGVQLTQRLLKTSRKVSHLAFLDVTGRIAGELLELCKLPDAMTHPDGMQIRITRQEIGRIVGCSREMAGRVLKALEEDGLISAHGKTIVVHGTR